jgi:hypothetical protein
MANTVTIAKPVLAAFLALRKSEKAGLGGFVINAHRAGCHCTYKEHKAHHH